MPASTVSTWVSRQIAKRAPNSDSAQLNLRNVYIFFSKEGGLFAVLLIITFIAGINYANNLVLGLCFYLASVWFISFHITFTHISGLKVELVDITTAEAGDPVWVTLKLINDSRQPRRQLLIGFADQNNKLSHTKFSHKNTVLLPQLKSELELQLPVATSLRGELTLPKLQIKTTYPFGIMRAWSVIYFAKTTWVTPKPLRFDWTEKRATLKNADLITGNQSISGQDDFDKLSSFVEGESLARVSWAHLARGQGLLTKHFADPVGLDYRLDYADMPATTHEQKLSQLAFAVNEMGRLNLPFQLILPSDLTSQSTVGQGSGFVQSCLLRLAKAP
ncbi:MULTISPECIES: hypothetical protein [Psychrobacter]|uniref:hypothetical protein n=1 Tax=Psychrobacter TaxID=497 RepID=UPI00146D3A1F|nr:MULTISPECIES: hypothetical protein [Psychrobacter]